MTSRPIISDQRFHGLDFLRAMAMLFGLLFHAPLLYYIPGMADAFKDFGVATATIPAMEPWLHLMIQWLHSWRMCVFFIISGFFAGLVLRKRSPTEFITDRLVKIGVTMIVFASAFDFLDGRFNGKLEHIWFLYYLMIFSLLIWLLAILPGNILLGKNNRKSHCEEKFSNSKATFQLLLIAGSLIIFRPIADNLDGGAIGIATNYTSIKFGGLLYFWLWFCAGFWLFDKRDLLYSAGSKFLTIFLGITGVLVFYFLSPKLNGIFGYKTITPSDTYDYIIFSLLKGLNTFVWVTFLILVSHQLMNKPRKFVGWLVTLSFPIYLLHMTPCMLISAILIGMGLSQILVVFGTVIASFLICLVLYYGLIKFTPLSWIILGYKKSWLKPF